MLSARFLTFILDRMYGGPPCDLLLTSVFSTGEAAGLCGRPSMVLDGSSACVCVSDRDCLVRQSGVVSAGLASASIIRADGGKMETGGREGREGRELVSRLQLAVIDVSVQMMIVRQISTLF